MSKSFRDLLAFQWALDLAAMIYERTSSFPRAELHGFTSQMRRAVVSVISNIAEGQGRITAGEFRQFLSNARGSMYEPDAQCIVARKLGFLSDADPVLDKQIRRTNGAIRALLRSIEKN